MKETEILFSQEHWLFKFEEQELKTIIPNTDHYARLGLSVVLLIYPLWLRHGHILKKAVGMGCLRVFEHPLIPRLWL
jgi:hypothetical protein